jgi:hypothetical protein
VRFDVRHFLARDVRDFERKRFSVQVFSIGVAFGKHVRAADSDAWFLRVHFDSFLRGAPQGAPRDPFILLVQAR